MFRETNADWAEGMQDTQYMGLRLALPESGTGVQGLGLRIIMGFLLLGVACLCMSATNKDNLPSQHLLLFQQACAMFLDMENHYHSVGNLLPHILQI